MSTALRSSGLLALAASSLLAGCPRSTPPAPAPPVDAARARTPAPAPATTGTLEATVVLDGPLARRVPLALPGSYTSDVPCRDSAARYAQPTDAVRPGPFQGALVHVEAHAPGRGTPRTHRFVLRDCDVQPRVVFARPYEKILFHADTPRPHVVHFGGGGGLDRMIIPGANDDERVFADKGFYPFILTTAPPFVGGAVYVLDNRFIDTTDATGIARITDLPPGNHPAHAFYPGVGEQTFGVEIRPGQVTRVEFHLQVRSPAVDAPTRTDAGRAPTIPVPQ